METTVQNFPNWQDIETLPKGVSGEKLGIYIHLPFCRTKCTYCAFVSGSPRSEEEMDRYTQAICRQLQDMANLTNRPVETVFMGGGTPSLMGIQRLSKIFQALHENYNIKDQAEITLEANPESASYELFSALREFGLNRISMGAQSFNQDELNRIGRVHNVETIYNAIENARKIGIDNISIDLIFALPGQRLENWDYSLDQAIKCGTTHLSAYGLSYEEGTLLHRQLKEGRVTPVLDDTYGEMYDRMRDKLRDHGYHHYEISNWAKPGFECQHNLIYWHRDDYLAFGVSAHGTFGGWRYSWIPDKNRFIAVLEETNDWQLKLIDESCRLNTDEAASDAMIFGLRLTKGINELSFNKRFGYLPSDRWKDTIQRLISLGWVKKTENNIHLTPETFLLSNEVFQEFLS